MAHSTTHHSFTCQHIKKILLVGDLCLLIVIQTEQWNLDLVCYSLHEPGNEKTCLWAFRQGLTQTGLYSHKRWLTS